MAATGSVTKVVSDRTGKISWRARVSWVDANGERHHASKTFATRTAGNAWRTKILNDLHNGDHLDVTRDSVDDLVAIWEERARQRISPGSLHLSMRTWRKHGKPALTGKRASGVKQTDIQAIYDDMQRQGYATNTILTVHRVLRQVFAMAVTDRKIKQNPCDGCSLPRVERNPPTIWSPEQVRRFVTFVQDKPTGPLWALLVTTGMRIGEAFALSWDDVDLATRQIRIEWTIAVDQAGDVVRKRGAKTRSSNRTIPLSDISIHALMAQRRAVARQRERVGAAWDASANLVFPGKDGRVHRTHTATQRFHRYRTALGLPYLTPHGLRHTAASLLFAAKVPPKVIQEQLGHASIAITLDLYAHLDEGMRQTAASQMDVVLSLVPTATTSLAKTAIKKRARQKCVTINRSAKKPRPISPPQ